MKPRNMQHNGKQVYAFGKVSFYLDQGAVWLGSAGDWKPAKLEELLQRARSSGRCGPTVR